MINRFYPLVFAAMLGIGAFAVPGVSTSAAAIPAFQKTGAYSAVDGDNTLLRDVAMRSWDRNRDGDRYRHRRGNYSHYYNGYYYSSPWWSLTVPLAIGGSDGYDGDHEEWCAERYRSYNPENNTWVSFSGEVNECISPF